PACEAPQELLITRVRGGAGETREEILLLEAEFAEVGPLRRIGQDLRRALQQRRHLPLRLDVRLLPHEAESLWVVQFGAGSDREQYVVGLGILPPAGVRVIGSNHSAP